MPATGRQQARRHAALSHLAGYDHCLACLIMLRWIEAPWPGVINDAYAPG
jgi:hypothetical protein